MILLSNKLKNCNLGSEARGSISTKLTSLLFVRTKVCNFGENSAAESNVKHLKKVKTRYIALVFFFKKKLTSNVGIDSSNSIVVNNQSTQTIKKRHVLELHNLIVRQINSIKLILQTPQSKKRDTKRFQSKQPPYMNI